MSLYICRGQESTHTLSLPTELFKSAEEACNATYNLVQIYSRSLGALVLPPHIQSCADDRKFYYVKNTYLGWGCKARTDLFDTTRGL